MKATYYQRNRERVLRRAKRWYASLPQSKRRKLIDYASRWQRENRSHYYERRKSARKAYEKAARDNARSWYVRSLLSLGSIVPPNAWPESLVALKQTHLKTQRLCRILATSKN